MNNRREERGRVLDLKLHVAWFKVNNRAQGEERNVVSDGFRWTSL